MESKEKLWRDATPEEEERYRAIVKDRVENSPYYSHIGLEVAGLAPGVSRIRMEAGSCLHNLNGVVHGGAIASVADAAAGVALATLLDGASQRPATVEMKINFCSPVTGGVLVGEGRVVHKGSRVAVCEADVSAADGRLVAKALATFIIIST